jgi:hypothetical protein
MPEMQWQRGAGAAVKGVGQPESYNKIDPELVNAARRRGPKADPLDMPNRAQYTFGAANASHPSPLPAFQ